MTDSRRRLVAGTIGACVGTLAYWWMLQRDVHILAAVGAGLVLGVSFGARRRSAVWGVLTGVLAVAVSLLVEWWFRPFVLDASLTFFVQHLADLPRNSLLSLVVVFAMGLWLGRGRSAKSKQDGDGR